MGVVLLKGEIEIDGRKATAGLRGVQKEATKTASTFKQSNQSAERLGKSLLTLGLNAGSAGKSLGALSRLGVGGILGAAALGSINKFGEAVKQASSDYYSSQKDLASAFETSFKATSVEQARAGVEKTEDSIEALRGKITQLGAMSGVLKTIEKFSGISLGVGDTERALAQAQTQLVFQEEIVKQKQEELRITEEIEQSSRQLVYQSKINQENLKIAGELAGEQDASVKIAKEGVKQANALYDENAQILNLLIETNREENNKDQIKARQLKKAELEFNILKGNNNLLRQEAQLKEKQGKLSQQAGGGVLGASKAGGQALDVARKQRERQLKTENFKVAEQIAPTQRDREKLAAQQAAGEMPSLGEQIRGGLTGVDPSQLAREAAASKFEKDRAPTSGLGQPASTGRLGQEQSSLSSETLTALKALVDLMKSGTVVK
jgi:hypothetical protein